MNTTPPATVKAGQLQPGMWFLDPDREPFGEGEPSPGRRPGTLRPAKVVEVVDTIDGRIHLTLDDYGRGGAWSASYPVDQELARDL